MASRSLGTLTLDLIAKTGGFERGMDRAARTSEKRMKEIQASAKKAGAILGTALVAGASAVAVAVKDSIDRMDDLSKAAQRAQMPTEEFSRLAYAGDLADVAMQDLVTSFGRLARAQGDAARGLATQEDAFNTLGIAFKNADGSLRSTTQVFLDFADVYQKFKGSPEVLATGMQIFGRSFQNLIPLLKDGREGLEAAAAEADRLGYTISTEAGQAAEEFNDNLTRLKTAVMGVVNIIAAEFLPDLVALSRDLVNSASDSDGLRGSIDSLADSLRSGVSWVLNFHDNLVILRSEMARLENAARQYSPMDGIRSLLDGGEYIAPYEQLVKRQQELADEADAARARIEGRSGPTIRLITPDSLPRRSTMPAAGPIIRNTTGGGKKGGKSEAEKEAEALARAYESMNERLNEQIALFGQTGEAAKIRYEIEQGALKGISEAEADSLIFRAEKLDLMVAEREAMEESMRLAEEEARQAAALAERQAMLLDDMQFELSLYGLTNRERERAIALRYAEADATSELGRAVVDLSDRLYEARKAQEVWDEFQRSLATAFEDLATGAKSLKDILKDFFDSIAAAITRSIAEQWAENITSWFRGAAGNSGSGGGFDWGSLIGSLFGGGKASGGSVSAGRMYEVNELGTEMFSANGRDYLLAGVNGHITPAHKVGGSINQTVQFLMPERPSPSTQSQIAQRAGIATQTAARRNG